MSEELHICKALTVRQPLADEIAFSKRDSLTMKFSTKFRGDLIVTSREGNGPRDGMTVCIVELCEVEKTGEGYEWRFKNPRPIVEMPCKSKHRKLWDYTYFQWEVVPYPTTDLTYFLKIPGREK